MAALAGATVAGTAIAVKARDRAGTSDARFGIQPAGGQDGTPDGTSPGNPAPGTADPDTADPDTEADGIPRMAARRSAGGGW
jgi:hypothetical protein